MTRRTTWVGAAALLLGFVLLGVDAARRETPTVDEFAHLPAGLAALRHGDFRVYPENPPLGRLLMALPTALAGAAVPAPPRLTGDWRPWIYGLEFFQANRADYLRLFFLARLAILALAAAGGLVLFLWARQRHGDGAALAALFLYGACPNLAAHGRLATVDAALTTLLLVVALEFDRWRAQPGIGRLMRFAVAGGLALLTKFTALLLLPLFWGLLVASTLQGRGLRRGWRLAALRLALVGTVALALLNAGYLFQGTLAPLASHRFESAAGRGVAQRLPGWLPLPLPRDFVAGLDAQTLDTERGEFGAYFAGRWTSKAPPLATPALLLFKLPLVVLALLLAAALAAARRPGAWLDEAVVWLPPVFLVAVMAASNALNPALRYLLPALPFLYLGIARLFVGCEPRSPKGAALLAAVAVLAVGVVGRHPHELGYFNSLAGGRAGGHRWLIDSNLDWGQDLFRVKPYMDAHRLTSVYLLYFGHVPPEVYGIDYALPGAEPRPGTYVVSVNFAKGYTYLAPDHGRMVRVAGGAPAWLRQRQPDSTLGDSLWVYRVS